MMLLRGSGVATASMLLLLVASGFALACAGGSAAGISGLRLPRVISFDGADGQRAFRLRLERDVVQVQDKQQKLLATLFLRT